MAAGSRRSKGLSPRVRGNQRLVQSAFLACRSIPACTGEPGFGPCFYVHSGVYPRVYGGTLCRTQSRDCIRGLSPRVRGNQKRGGASARSPGSIPACTGEPADPRAPQGLNAVYPRVYGGTQSVLDRMQGARGLSPRVRGNPRRPTAWWTRLRSIPACTGEPRARVRAAKWGRVYPRVYGGTSSSRAIQSRRKGLSPRVRGNRRLPACVLGT